jgi:hypothetical protein
MFSAFSPLTIMSERQMAYVRSFRSWPCACSVTSGLRAELAQPVLGDGQHPPVPQPGSNSVRTMPRLRSTASSSQNSRSTIRLITTRGGRRHRSPDGDRDLSPACSTTGIDTPVLYELRA